MPEDNGKVLGGEPTACTRFQYAPRDTKIISQHIMFGSAGSVLEERLAQKANEAAFHERLQLLTRSSATIHAQSAGKCAGDFVDIKVDGIAVEFPEVRARGWYWVSASASMSTIAYP